MHIRLLPLLLLISLFVVSTPIVTGHICLISPIQRGNFSIATPGASPCYQKVGPCPSDILGTVTTIVAGQPFEISFQQNLNHYYTKQPGYLDASIAYDTSHPAETDFQSIGAPITDINAMNEINQWNFTMNVDIPNVLTDKAVLRVRYVSNNPLENDRGEIFYQCADIRIVTAEQCAKGQYKKARTPVKPIIPITRLPRKPTHLPTSDPIDYSCCTPKQWTLTSSEMSSWRHAPTNGMIVYDAINQLMRVDTDSGMGTTIYDGYFQMYLNFSSGIEYYFNVYDNTCEEYGLDYWNDWCYGTKEESETYMGSYVAIGHTYDYWQNGNFVFLNERGTCYPTELSYVGSVTEYIDVKPTVDPTAFQPPAICLHHAKKMERSSKRIHPRFGASVQPTQP